MEREGGNGGERGSLGEVLVNKRCARCDLIDL